MCLMIDLWVPCNWNLAAHTYVASQKKNKINLGIIFPFIINLNFSDEQKWSPFFFILVTMTVDQKTLTRIAHNDTSLTTLDLEVG